ncbi:F-box/WD repeat-containing protein 9-like [Tropilaelaps mercedesae]|uniref:F-box/WD repeat-containing protein 9-like n=1 Tax=Tropilaelaps mercedesae TaxID=418985 RepID=A0A1V9Y3X2_9ACAR|nr:F-box/WD repeat-containing protein 9-like [Tropilaelaps mercedesae]
MTSSSCTLESLPNEILWHILSFLKPGFIAKVLPHVSPRFRALVKEQSLWRSRVYARWPALHPTPPGDWVDCCRQREEHWAAFRGWEDEGGVKQIKKDNAHIAAVDAIKFIQNDCLFVSGGRDHQLRVWKIDAEEVSLHKDFSNAHEAWVWAVEQLDETTLVSGSFDQTVKTWDLEKQGLVDTFKLPAAVLSLAIREHLLACGTRHKVHLKDVRAKNDIKVFEYHKDIVLTLAMDDKVIMSGSTDGTMAIFDIRAEKVSQTIKLKGYPTAISHHDDGQTWVGTSRGYLACFDTRSLPGSAELTMQRRVSYRSVRSVTHSWGSVVLAAGDDRLLVLEPTKTAASITRQTIKEGITKASMHNRTICAAGASGELLVWVPVEA